MTDVGGRHERSPREWAYRHPVRLGLAVFCVVYVPLAVQGAINHDPVEMMGPLPGAVLLGAIGFAMYRWGPSPGRTHPDDLSAADSGSVAEAPSESARTLAQAAQLSALICPALGPALVWLAGREQHFVRAYAVQAFSLQLVLCGAMVAFVITGRATDFTGGAFTFVWIAGTAVYAYALAVSLIGTIKAANGIMWRYPLNLHPDR